MRTETLRETEAQGTGKDRIRRPRPGSRGESSGKAPSHRGAETDRESDRERVGDGGGRRPWKTGDWKSGDTDPNRLPSVL